MLEDLFINPPQSAEQSSKPRAIIINHTDWNHVAETNRRKSIVQNVRKGRRKVVTYNMYENIIPLQEFEALPKETKREVITLWSSKYTIKDIEAVWGVSKWKYSHYKQVFGLTKPAINARNAGHQKDKTGDQKEKKTGKEEKGVGVVEADSQAKPKEKEKPVTVAPLSQFTLNKKMTGMELARKLMDMASYYEKDTCTYEARIVITELAQEEA